MSEWNTILVYDERFESGPRFVASFERVPSDWTTAELMKRYGIAEHLCVYADNFKDRNCIHRGTRFRND